MEDVRIKLSAIWVARMLTGFLGDVLRFLEPGMMEKIGTGQVEGMRLSHGMLLVGAMVMTLPIGMVFLSLTLKHRVNRWANIILAIALFGFDAVGLPSYTALYSVFLICVGLAFNVLTVWYAWRWRVPRIDRIGPPHLP